MRRGFFSFIFLPQQKNELAREGRNPHLPRWHGKDGAATRPEEVGPYQLPELVHPHIFKPMPKAWAGYMTAFETALSPKALAKEVRPLYAFFSILIVVYGCKSSIGEKHVNVALGKTVNCLFLERMCSHPYWLAVERANHLKA